MPLFGAHMSVAGGLFKAAEAAAALGMQTVQIFTKNANQWAGKPLTDDDIRAFKQAVAAAGLKHPTAHDSYLINLAAADETLFQKSIDALVIELERAETLGLDYLVSHPGSHTGSGEEAGLKRIVSGIDVVHARCAGFHVQILLETTAGQGTTLGHRFEHLGTIRAGVREPERLGTCLDTCHIFAAGYPLATRGDYDDTMGAFDEAIGLEHLRLFHINDSVKPLGCRVDRHAGIGLGEIGIDSFRRLVTDKRFHDRPMILETPKEDEAGELTMDPINLGLLKGMKPLTRKEEAKMTRLFK